MRLKFISSALNKMGKSKLFLLKLKPLRIQDMSEGQNQHGLTFKSVNNESGLMYKIPRGWTLHKKHECFDANGK